MPWLLSAVTNLGDISLLGFTTLAGVVYLLIARCTRGAMALALAFLTTVVVTSALKALFISCQPLPILSNIHSPSGHAALATAVYGTFALLIASYSGEWRERLAMLAAFILVALIAASRVALGYHTIQEVVLGLIVGYIMLFFSRWYLHRNPPQPFNALLLMLAMLCPMIACYGMHFPAEKTIQRLAFTFISPLCPTH